MCKLCPCSACHPGYWARVKVAEKKRIPVLEFETICNWLDVLHFIDDNTTAIRTA